MRGDSRLVFADLSRPDNPNRYIEAGALLDDFFQIAQTRTQVTNVQPNDQFLMWDVGGAQVREVDFSVISAQLMLNTGITVNTLPNLPSGEIADHDVLLIEDNSESWAQKHITIGELAARLADGVTITSNAGTLTSVGGGMGGGDNTLAVLTEALDGDGTDDLALVTPNAGTATQQDFMLIYDRSSSALRRTGLGDLAAQISANPFAGSTFYTADVAPGDAVLMRDISLGINHSLSLEHLYGQMFTIAGLHQTAPAADDQIVILDVSSNILRHVRWDQFNQGSGGLTQAQVDARILDRLPTPSAGQATIHQAGQTVEGATWETRFGWTPQRLQTQIATWASNGGGALNGYVVPDGGATGQVLAKASAAARDTEWLGLAAVATSGNYNDLTNRPTIPTDTNNYVTGGSVTGTTLTLTRQGLGDVTITGLPSGGGGTADGVVTGGSVSGTTLTLTRSVGGDVVITGLPSGGGGGDSITELHSGVQQLTTNLQELGAGIDCPSTGYIRVYVEGAGNREGAVGSATIPAARLLAAQKAINSTWNADDADQRTIPIGANRSISVATNSDGANNNILIAAQDTNGSGDFQVIVEHVVPGGGMGGGGATFDISALPNLASSDLAGHDQFAVYDVSASEHKHITHGSLAAALADGTTITSNDGVLSAVGGMGGGLTQAQVLALIADPAEQGNTDRWPENKMTGIPTSFLGQSWNADDTRLTLGLNRSGGLSAITRDIDIPDRYRIPSGGAARAFLGKASGSDYDYFWRDASNFVVDVDFDSAAGHLDVSTYDGGNTRFDIPNTEVDNVVLSLNASDQLITTISFNDPNAPDVTSNALTLPTGGGGSGILVRDSTNAFAMTGITALVFDNGDFELTGTGVVANIAARGGGGTAFTINTLPNLASSQIAHDDRMAIEDRSDSWAQHSITVGELAARLADGTTITSANGTLSAVASSSYGDTDVRDYLNALNDYAGARILSATPFNQDPTWIEGWWAGEAGAGNADYEAGQHVVAHGRAYLAVDNASGINADGIVQAARGVNPNNAHNDTFRLVEGWNDNLENLGTPADGDFLSLVDISDGFALKRITFDDFVTALNIPTDSGISQTDADARYLQLTGGTLTSDLRIEQDSNATALTLERSATAGNTTFQAIDDGDSRAWLQINRQVGSTDMNPGILMGPGGSGNRDVNLYRRDPNVWKTDDTFDAADYEIGGVNLLASITGADPHLPFLLADLEVNTAKEWEDSQFSTTFGISMSRDDHSTVAAVDGLTYNILHNTGSLSNFFGWWIYGRIPRQRTVGGDTFDTDWHDYRVHAQETNPPHEYPRTYATWIEIGTDATYRYARINLNHAIQNYTYQAQADLDRVTGTSYHGEIPDAAQVTGGVFDAARIPNLPASRITSGTFGTARLGTGTRNSTTVLHGDGVFRTGGPTFSTERSVNMNFGGGAASSFKATGFSWNAGDRVIFWSVGRESSNVNQNDAPGYILFTSKLAALTATSAGTNIAGLTRGTHYITVNVQGQSGATDANTYYFARTSSNELLMESQDFSEDAYPLRAISL